MQIMNQCARCQADFICNKEDIRQCECSQLRLSSATQQFLKKTRWGCLCNRCLGHFEEQLTQANTIPFATQIHSLKENIHFYKQGNLVVFSELYLIQRGYCCQSGCRYCPYGFNKATIKSNL
jgi:hypothetical protein